jgi:hypothetical protein
VFKIPGLTSRSPEKQRQTTWDHPAGWMSSTISMTLAVGSSGPEPERTNDSDAHTRFQLNRCAEENSDLLAIPQ